MAVERVLVSSILLISEGEQAKSVKKLDNFHRKKHFVAFFCDGACKTLREQIPFPPCFRMYSCVLLYRAVLMSGFLIISSPHSATSGADAAWCGPR